MEENLNVKGSENTSLEEMQDNKKIIDMNHHIKIPSNIDVEDVVEKVLKIPGVRINRNEFLNSIFNRLSLEDFQNILEVGPIEAGVSREDLMKIAKKIVGERTTVSTIASFLAGLPGGVAMVATIPTDLVQFFVISLRLAQELAYLYGQPDIWDEGLSNHEQVKMQMILYCGVMFGANSASAGVRVLSSALAKQALIKIPEMTLTKTVYYPLVKGIAKAVGVTMTKELFAKGVSKIVPIVGGVVSGGITLASMLPMGLKLVDTLDKANFDYTEEKFKQDLETIQNVGEDYIEAQEKLK